MLKIQRVSIAALLAMAVAGPAGAQNINPDLGYYYWDLVGTKGIETRQSGDVETSWEFNTSRMEYLYDFCGKVDSFIGFAVDRQRMKISDAPDGFTGATRQKSQFGEIYFGQHFKTSDFSDFYFRAGQIRAEGDFVDYWGKEYKNRNLFEIGFRSRVGDRRNLELTQKTRYDNLNELQVEMGFLYHSAASFSFGFGYLIKGDVKARNAAGEPVEITQQDSATFTLRINI